jgi:hypothetical protein
VPPVRQATIAADISDKTIANAIKNGISEHCDLGQTAGRAGLLREQHADHHDAGRTYKKAQAEAARQERSAP